MTATPSGLHAKYDVRRTDGRDQPGQRHHGCFLFVLDPDHDPAARAALEFYAEQVEDTRPQLAADLRGRYPRHHDPIPTNPLSTEENQPVTTIDDIRAAMQAAVDEHGMESLQVLDVAETLVQDFDDIEYLGSHDGEEARWGSRDHYVYRLPDGTFVGVQYYSGATECQSSHFEGEVVELEQQSVVVYVPKEW